MAPPRGIVTHAVHGTKAIFCFFFLTRSEPSMPRSADREGFDRVVRSWGWGRCTGRRRAPRGNCVACRRRSRRSSGPRR
eukprot:259925-Prorocentrum_minimum.AAC.1